MRNKIAAAFLLASWPVCVIHRKWESEPLREVSWIKYDYVCGDAVRQDFRWYWVANELWLSAVFVLLAWLVATSKTYTLRMLILANLWISVIDIVNYWLFFRRSDWLLGAEGTVMVVATVIITTHASKHRNEKTS